jgi:hypothetical protein
MSPVNAEAPGDVGRAGVPNFLPSEPVWSSRTQWGAIAAGAFGGIAVAILMATLGAALGISAGAAAGASSSGTASGEAAEKAVAAFGIGAAVWILLTALVTGLVGGWVLNSCARRDRPYSSFIFGGITWALGVSIAMLVTVPGLGGVFSGLGAGGGAAAATAANQSPGMFRMTAPRTEQEQPRTMTDEEKAMAKDAADKAAATVAAAAWVMLGAQLISIAATMFAAGWRRHTGTRVVTEVRPRPAPTL